MEYGVGSSTIYDIKSQMKKLRDYMKATDTPKAVENRHTLQYHHGEMMDKVLYEWFTLKRSEGVTITGPISFLFKYPETSVIWHVGGPVDAG